MNSVELEQLYELARLHWLETSFYDGLGQFRQSSPQAIIAVLQSLGVPIDSLADVTEALRDLKSAKKDDFVEPITVAWKAESTELSIRLKTSAPLKGSLRMESGEERHLEMEPRNGSNDQYGDYALPAELACGYHFLEVETSCCCGKTLLIVAPKSAFSPPQDGNKWGAFLPLYALTSETNWGAGNFTELGRLAQWIASLGGHFVGTLPLFSAFLQNPLDPSPYAPVSRLFWNEFFIDPTETPEWSSSRGAQEIYGSNAFQAELLSHRDSTWVDYESQMKSKRRVLERLALTFFGRGGRDLSSFRQFLTTNAEVEDYAAFRAAQENLSQPWGVWPKRLRDGILLEHDYDPQVKDYHLYVQWVADRQMRSIQQLSREESVGLYLDLPLGVHPDGYDVWRNQKLFVPGAAGGAPPDSFFTNGQDWGFRPLHPLHSRNEHHSYFRRIIRHMMNHSDLLRIDHVMSMHRLYWVPSGFSAADGVYVHYPWEELYAILALESHRQKCVIVGEDLGTVPPIVRESMSEHDIHRMYVSIFEISPDKVPPFNEPPRDVLASLNTHDTATFAAFWQGLDIEERREMDLLNDQAYEEESSGRTSATSSILSYFGIDGDCESSDVQREVLRALLAYLSRSEAKYLLINLEDLWLEAVSQNVPGTGPEKPNWRHKTRLGFEQFSNAPEILGFLKEIDLLRRKMKDDG